MPQAHFHVDDDGNLVFRFIEANETDIARQVAIIKDVYSWAIKANASVHFKINGVKVAIDPPAKAVESSVVTPMTGPWR